MTWLTGIDLSWSDLGEGDRCRESDFVVLAQNYEDAPELLLGECKTNMGVDDDQIDRLIAAAKRWFDSGIKTFIMFAEAGGPFSDSELDIDRCASTIDLNFILLTATELEPYEPYENVKSNKIRTTTPTTLAEWAG